MINKRLDSVDIRGFYKSVCQIKDMKTDKLSDE